MDTHTLAHHVLLYQYLHRGRAWSGVDARDFGKFDAFALGAAPVRRARREVESSQKRRRGSLQGGIACD